MNARLHRLIGARDKLVEQQATKASEVETLAAKIETYKQAIRVAEELATAARKNICDSVTGLASSAMQDIFGEGAGCRLEYVEVGERGDHKPKFTAWDGGGVEQDPLRGMGGSSAKLIGIALQIYLLVRTGGLKLLCLDEPTAKCDEANALRFAQFIASLSEKLGLQVLMIAHEAQGQMEQVADQVLHVTREGKTSRITSN